MELETNKLAVPVLPAAFGELPPDVVDYLRQVNDYLQAAHRDLQKLGGTP